MGGRVPIFQHVLEAAGAMRSNYRGRPTDRTALVGFLDANGWFQGERDGDDVLVEWDGTREERLAFWLGAYGLDYGAKLDLLLERGAASLPDTCGAFGEFAEGRGASSRRSLACVLDFLLSSLRGEVASLGEDGVDALVSESARFLNLRSRKTLAAFLDYLRQRGMAPGCRYRAEPMAVYRPDVSAYTMETFLGMAHLVFSEESWEENRLLEQAARSRRVAGILAFLSLHFYTALRAEDMRRLPKPRLPEPGALSLEGILSGRLGRRDFERLVDCWEMEVDVFQRSPHKTAGGRRKADVKVLVPTSLRETVGRILALAAAHCGEGDGAWLFRGRVRRRDVDAIFTAHAWPEMGKSFSTRRGNKAFLQGTQFAGEGGSIDSYLIPALFRSHFFSFGHLPKTTAVYLGDHAFTGRTPGVVLYQLFERGAMGFVLSALLERAGCSRYRSIPMEGQTTLIQGLGLEPRQAEDVVVSVGLAEARARETVAEIFSQWDGGELAPDAVGILGRVASGAAPAKQDHLHCVRIAAGRPCPYRERSSCMGCGAEVYTRSSFHLLVQEYVLLSKRLRSGEGSERVRILRILEDGVLPAISQMIESAHALYQEELADFYSTIVERGKQSVRSLGNV